MASHRSAYSPSRSQTAAAAVALQVGWGEPKANRKHCTRKPDFFVLCCVLSRDLEAHSLNRERKVHEWANKIPLICVCAHKHSRRTHASTQQQCDSVWRHQSGSCFFPDHTLLHVACKRASVCVRSRIAKRENFPFQNGDQQKKCFTTSAWLLKTIPVRCSDATPREFHWLHRLTRSRVFPSKIHY